MNPSLFSGTAEYYAAFRPDYPQGLYDVARRTFALTNEPRGTLLDLGTGPGLIALALAQHFGHVVGVDTDPSMLQAAQQTATARGVEHAAWHHLPAEDLPELDGTPDSGPYRLVTIGSALHWMDQPRVLELIRDRLEPGGGVFLAGFPGFISFDEPGEGDEISRIVVPVVRQYLGDTRRAGTGTFTPPPKRWEAYLEEAGYESIDAGLEGLNVEFDHDAVVGLTFSTSFANREILGERAEAFEQDLRTALRERAPSGSIQRRFEAEWVLARSGK